jgi:hypothetical protein
VQGRIHSRSGNGAPQDHLRVVLELSGHQIARLLQPEHWEQWEIGNFTMIHHELRLVIVFGEPWSFSLTRFGARDDEETVHLTSHLGWWESRRIRKLIQRKVKSRRDSARRAAEERAIEELLRS